MVIKQATELTTMVRARELETNRYLFPDHLPSILRGWRVGAGSLWPVEQALDEPVTHNGTAAGPAMRKSYANFPPSFSSLARGPSVCTIGTADGSFVVPLEFPSPVLRTVGPVHTPKKIGVLSKSSTHPPKNEVLSKSFHTRKRIEVSSNSFAN